MEAATTKTKPVKQDAIVPVEPKSDNKLRSVQAKKFSPSGLQSVGQDYDTLTVTAPADWDYEDALKPAAWGNVCTLVAKDALNTRRDKIGSLIELRSADHAYFAILYIKAITLDHLGHPNGLDVACVGPSFDKTGMACPIDVKTGLPWAGRK